MQRVRIPASGPKAGGIVTLEMVNTIDRAPVIRFTNGVIFLEADGLRFIDSEERQLLVQPDGDSSRLYYILDVTLPEGIPEGEYEYKATAGGEVISCGLAIVGEPAPAVESYDKPVQYEQYNAI